MNERLRWLVIYVSAVCGIASITMVTAVVVLKSLQFMIELIP